MIAGFPAPIKATTRPASPPIAMPTAKTMSLFSIIVMLIVAVNTGIVIFAHGSSVPSANEAVRVVAEAAAAGSFERFETAFLEARPNLAEAVARLAGSGVTRILVVPYFLTLGIHLQRDLPAVVEQLAKAHPNVEIRVTPPLDQHPALAQILRERAQAALIAWK
jgi:sirohydrochlorin ferrochelatase